MCGIAGTVRWNATASEPARLAETAAMVEAVAHRGPDDQRTVQSGTAVMGAARLVIRGLQDGQQPMVHEGSGVVVVCNGEIDNHPELKAFLASHGRTVSAKNDVAVIADLYALLGAHCVERLKGAFALAIWDPVRQELLLARDRAGERPLFYAADENGVSFASEIASLVTALGRPLPKDIQGIRDYLQRGYFGAPHSPFRNTRKVRPAEVITFSRGTPEHRRYWRWNLPAPVGRTADAQTFDRIFREAVRRQSDVDVPYGVFLSGGIDSSLVAAVLRSLRPGYPLTGYTLRFHEPSFDEGSFALRMAEMLEIPCETVWVKSEDFPRELAGLIAHTGEPLADPAWIPTALLARRAAQDAKIALVGEGGDELFGGYPTYIGALVSGRFAHLPKPIKSALAALVSRWPPSQKKMTLSFLLKKFVAGAELAGMARHLLWTASIDPSLLARLGVEPVTPEIQPGPEEEGLLDALQRYDLENTLAEGLLTKADRASMLSAIELRAPFLDPDVMEFAAGLSVEQRVKGVTTKVFLKNYALRYLPRAIVHRKKRGLSVPLTAWLRGPLFPWAEGLLSNPLLDSIGVRRAEALTLLQEHRQLRSDHARPLWTLLVLSEWLNWAASRDLA
jgi:asparagine synthase (glutamine-hydrolysing)